jgi:hypothetical protein
MTTIRNVIPSDVHAQLDQECRGLAYVPFDSQASMILSMVINLSIRAYAETTCPINATDLDACAELLASNKEIRDMLEKAHRSGQYSQIRELRAWPTSFLLFLH